MSSDFVVWSTTLLMMPALCASAKNTQDFGTCPARLTVTQTIKGGVAEGWTGFGSNEDHPFVAVSFTSGPPDMKAVLAPSKEIKGKKLTTATWEFPDTSGGYWVACQYSGTTAIVARELGRNVSTCMVEYDNRFSSPVVNKWECKYRPKND